MSRKGGHYTCPECGKQVHETRRDAKALARRAHQGEQHLTVYKCPEGYGYHLGHIPKSIVRGDYPRDMLRGEPMGTSKSGWCLDGHHERCQYAPCNCECHGGTDE